MTFTDDIVITVTQVSTHHVPEPSQQSAASDGGTKSERLRRDSGFACGGSESTSQAPMWPARYSHTPELPTLLMPKCCLVNLSTTESKVKDVFGISTLESSAGLQQKMRMNLCHLLYALNSLLIMRSR